MELRKVRQAILPDDRLILRMHFIAIASHGRVPRPRTLSGCWLGKGGFFDLPLHPTRPGLHARGPVRGHCPCDLSQGFALGTHQRAFVLLGTMTGAHPPLDPDRGFALGTHQGLSRPLETTRQGLSRPRHPLVRAIKLRHHDGRLCLLRPPRADHHRSPREGARPLRRAGASGARGGMSGAVKARQQPAEPNARSLP